MLQISNGILSIPGLRAHILYFRKYARVMSTQSGARSVLRIRLPSGRFLRVAWHYLEIPPFAISLSGVLLYFGNGRGFPFLPGREKRF